VKSFYSAGLLFDVLQVFGDLSEDVKFCLYYIIFKNKYFAINPFSW
jgi:hypothetical protein